MIRCLLAYFENQSPDEMPYIRVPLHTGKLLLMIQVLVRLNFVQKKKT